MAETEERPCPTWGDHEWGSPRLVGAGKHPINGRWQRFESKCARCPRVSGETRWLGVAPSAYGTAVGQTQETSE